MPSVRPGPPQDLVVLLRSSKKSHLTRRLQLLDEARLLQLGENRFQFAITLWLRAPHSGLVREMPK